MKTIFIAAAMTAALIWIGGRLWKRRRHVYDPNDHSQVSRAWLNENVYDKGERRLK